MSIRETTAKDIVTVLGEITDPKPILVTREPFEPTELAITQFPAILVQSTNEEKSTITMGMSSVGLRQGTILFEIRGFVRGNDLDTRRNDLIEAIEESLDQDRYRNQTGVVINSEILSIEVISRMAPLAEFLMIYSVEYRHIRQVL
jgi:hypothetical protein